MQCVIDVNPVMLHRSLDRVPSFQFDGSARSRTAIVFGGHLFEDAVPQSERRIAKAREMEALQQFRIDQGTRTNNFSASRTDPRHFDALLQSLAGNQLGDASCHLARDVTGRAALAGTSKM